MRARDSLRYVHSLIAEVSRGIVTDGRGTTPGPTGMQEEQVRHHSGGLRPRQVPCLPFTARATSPSNFSFGSLARMTTLLRGGMQCNCRDSDRAA